ncbi:MAG: hypothetical protein LH491_07590 [Pseudoxanthomonas sp.]|nr:hypothetical protein [Pseudoxanthomonas sp.]
MSAVIGIGMIGLVESTEAVMKSLIPVLFLLCLATPLAAAINPDNFKRDATQVVKLRETARIVQVIRHDESEWQRVTLAGVVVANRHASESSMGQVMVIDYTVDLTRRALARQAHRSAQGNRVSAQLTYEPDPPVVDGEGMCWAHLVPAGQRTVNTYHASAVLDPGETNIAGGVYAPAAGRTPSNT